MFVHMSIHHPRAGQEQALIDSMHRYGQAMQAHPGFQRAHALRDQDSGRLVGLAIWDSERAWSDARTAMQAAIENDDFDAWEVEPPTVFHMDEV